MRLKDITRQIKQKKLATNPDQRLTRVPVSHDTAHVSLFGLKYNKLQGQGMTRVPVSNDTTRVNVIGAYTSRKKMDNG